jgi:exoribonuclease II
VRGKPENFNRPDYNFRLIRDAGPSQGAKAPLGLTPAAPSLPAQTGTGGRDSASRRGPSSEAHEMASVGANKYGNDGHEPVGNEQVQISVRQRGAPLDLIVAEAMILANSTWGNWLAELGVPAIYRSQASLAPGVKVRMGTKALPHAGIGVKSYAWSTSPLRRYTDLVNQWQIIACARHGRTAALAAPFKPKDADLFSIISGFDAAYSAYNGFQGAIERFWTLKYVQQQGLTELVCTVFKDNMARADDIPLVLPVLGAQGLPRGARVRIKLGDIDEVALDIHGTVIERLDTVPEPSAEEAEEEEGGHLAAGPIAIAVDVNETDSPSGDNPAS